MRTFVCFTALISFVLASCAESTHQRQRLNLNNRLDDGASQSTETQTIHTEASRSLYSQLQSVPATYEGKVVTLSGIVLKARRLQGLTEVEVLQLPDDVYGRPTEDRHHSEGRFLARQTSSFLDPAILATGPIVTVVGSVEESVERPLEPGSDSYSYPVIAIQQLMVWPSELVHSNGPSYPVASNTRSLIQSNTNATFLLDVIGPVLRVIFQGIFNSSRSDHPAAYSPPSYFSGSSSDYRSSPRPKGYPTPVSKT